MNKKTDLYTLIHKAQRAHLFALCTRLGRADLSDREEMEEIKQQLRAMIDHLRKHSYHEETYVHPIFAEIGDVAAVHLHEEHDELEEAILKLENTVEKEQWTALYPEFNRFIACYLAHQDEEETTQVEVLWKYVDESRLAAAMNAFLANRSPALAMEDLKFVLPALSILELAHMFSGMKANAPPQAFEAACQIAKASLEPDRWAQLSKKLNHEALVS